MKNNMRWRLAVCIVVAIFTGNLFGCNNLSREETSFSSVAELEKIQKANTFSAADYQKKMQEGRVDISGYREVYQNDVEVLQRKDYKNIHFKNCEFQDIPNVKQLSVLAASEHGISVQESWDTIADWLKSVGKQDQVDMKKDVYVASEQFAGQGESDWEWPLFYEHKSELDSGAGAYISTNLCHIQMAANGIYSMSDGKMTAYLGSSSKAKFDALGNNSEEVAEAGTVSALAHKKCTLTDGSLSVQKGAELVKKYFEAGTPFPCEDGVTVDVPEVRIFKLRDVYGYDYSVRRIYNAVPFACGDFGSRRYYYNYFVNEDIKHAFVIDGSGVSAFCGYNESEKLNAVFTDDKIISLCDMAENVSQNLAAFLDVWIDSAELVYVPVSFDGAEGNTIFPCWQFSGTNKTKGENIRIYADVFTGDIYFYTFGGKE